MNPMLFILALLMVSNLDGCVFVGGGAGFINDWIVERLVEEFSCVVVLSN